MSALEERVKGVLVSEEEAKEIVERLGKQISKDYEGKNLVLVSVLKGAVVFMADLMRAIDIPLSIDFMVVSSYNKTESTGTVKIIKDLDTDLTGKDILIYNIWQIVGNAFAWIVVAPVLDIVIYSEPVELVFTQGVVAAISNAVSAGVIGTILLVLYSKTRAKKGSLTKE